MFEQPTATIDLAHRGFFAASGDTRQVWARDTAPGSSAVVFLPEGGVSDEIRDRCRAGTLTCPLPNCPDPRFIARGGDTRRHHFAHRVAHVKHSTAAIWRAEAMAMLAEWADRYPSAHVTADEHDGVACVQVRSEKTGRTVELQITYDRRAQVTPQAAAGRQLLVGHTRGILLPRQPCGERPEAWWCGEGRLVGDLVYRDGFAVAVNPEQRLVGTITLGFKARAAGLLKPGGVTGPHPLLCIVCRLEDCRLTEQGLLTPVAQRLLDLDAAREREAQRRQQAGRTRRAAPQPAAPAAAGKARPQVQPFPAPPHDARRAEYLRRAEGLTDDERRALLREMFLPPELR